MNDVMNMKTVITNDDGYESDGIDALADEIEKVSDIVIVAPRANQSGISHNFTTGRPIAVEEKTHKSRDVFVVQGTPADCVSLAVLELVGRQNINLVVSGINHGPNLGYRDICRSGTVAAVREAAFYNIPSVAFSLYIDKRTKTDYESCAGFAAEFCSWLMDRYALGPEIFNNTYININFPVQFDKNMVKVTRPCTVSNSLYYRKVRKGQNNIYYLEDADKSAEAFTDADAIDKGFISINVLRLLNDSDGKKELEELIRQEFEY